MRLQNPAAMVEKERTAATSSSGFAALDSQMQKQASRNLSVLAMVYASVYAVAFLTGWITHMIGEGRFHAPYLVNWIAAVISIGVSLFVGRGLP